MTVAVPGRVDPREGRRCELTSFDLLRRPQSSTTTTASEIVHGTMSDTKTSDHPMRIGFIHPDLGIGTSLVDLALSVSRPELTSCWPVSCFLLLALGGAERLVVDAAVALQRRGHNVEIFTSRHDPTRCFAETRDGELDVSWLPPSLPRPRS